MVENRVVNGFAFKSVDAATPLRVKDEDLIAVLESKTGSVLNRNTLNGDVKRVQDLFKERGYAVLVLDAKQGPDGILVFNIQQARISRIELAGLSKTKPSIVRKQLRIKPNDVFDQVLLRRDLNRIYDLGFFEDVTYKVDDDPEKPGSLILTITLKEKRTGQFTFGLGFDSRSKLTGFRHAGRKQLCAARVSAFMVRSKRARSRLSTCRLRRSVRGAEITPATTSICSAAVSYREPRLVSLVTGIAENQYTVFYRRTTHGWTHQLFGAAGRRSHQKDICWATVTRAPVCARPTLSTGSISAPVTSLAGFGTYCGVFGAVFCATGAICSLIPVAADANKFCSNRPPASSAATRVSASSISMCDVIFRLWARKKSEELPKVVLANRLVIGQSFGQLPPFEQYFVGGSETVRGYDVDAQLGDNQVYNNLELRYRFQKKLTLVAFIDAGRASGGRFANDDSVLYSIGGGVRLQTPIGPIRFDVGFGRDGARTHFAIGPTF